MFGVVVVGGIVVVGAVEVVVVDGVEVVVETVGIKSIVDSVKVLCGKMFIIKQGRRHALMTP